MTTAITIYVTKVEKKNDLKKPNWPQPVHTSNPLIPNVREWIGHSAVAEK
jgi:hypothetical protein